MISASQTDNPYEQLGCWDCDLTWWVKPLQGKLPVYPHCCCPQCGQIGLWVGGSGCGRIADLPCVQWRSIPLVEQDREAVRGLGVCSKLPRTQKEAARQVVNFLQSVHRSWEQYEKKGILASEGLAVFLRFSSSIPCHQRCPRTNEPALLDRFGVCPECGREHIQQHHGRFSDLDLQALQGE